MTKRKWISATVNKEYSDDPDEGLDEVERGDIVILEVDEHGRRTWYKS